MVITWEGEMVTTVWWCKDDSNLTNEDQKMQLKVGKHMGNGKKFGMKSYFLVYWLITSSLYQSLQCIQVTQRGDKEPDIWNQHMTFKYPNKSQSPTQSWILVDNSPFYPMKASKHLCKLFAVVNNSTWGPPSNKRLGFFSAPLEIKMRV